MRSRGLRVYAVIATLAIAGHLVAPRPTVAEALFLLTILLAVLGCSVGLRRHRPLRYLPWRWLQLGLSAAFVGTVLTRGLEAMGGALVLGRALQGFAYLCAMAVMVTLSGHRGGQDRLDRLLASAIVATAAAIVAWIFVVQSLWSVEAATGSGDVVRALLPVVSLSVAVVLLQLLSTMGGGLRAYGFVAAGLVAFFLADLGDATGMLAGGASADGSESLRLAAFALIGAATLHPSIRDAGDVPNRSTHRLSRSELAAVLVAGVAGPVSLILRLDAASRMELAVIGVGSAVLVTLVVARMWRLMRAFADSAARENEDRFRALVENAGDVICVIDADGIIRYVSPTAERVWGYTPEQMAESGFGMIEAADLPRISGLVAELIDGPPGGTGRVEGEMRHADGTLRRFEAVYANRLHDPAIRGLVVTSHDVTERFDLEQRLWKQAFVDQLTGLPNRALLLEQTQETLDTATASSLPALAVIDLDDFKTVNDSLGPTRGDELLQAVGARLEAVGGDEVLTARLSGDAFALLARTDGTEEAGRILAVTAIEALARPLTLAGRRIEPRASVGVALGTPDATASELLREADVAMHVTKVEARGGYRVFDPAMHADAVRRLQLQLDLGTAIERGQLWLAYQPIHDLRTGHRVAVEALVRWDHPVRGPVSPAEFIPLAEGSGAIGALGDFVLRRACADVAALRAATCSDLSVSVNLSPAQLGDPALAEQVASALESSGLPASRLTLEVTEGVFLGHSRGVIHALDSLRALGIRLAIDDFGTGYCALGYLTKFRFDVVKIDRSFVEVLDMPGADRRVTMGILELVASLEVPAVAEGIETPEQLEALLAAGCEFGQGFHWSRPVPLSELIGAAEVRPGGTASEPGSSGTTRGRLT